MQRAAILTVLVFLSTTLLGTLPAAAQDPVQILDIDTYERTVAPSEPTSINWTVRNIDSVPYDIRIASEPVEGWSVTVSPNLIQNLSPNRAATVRVDVTPPAEVDAETTLSLRIIFTVVQDGSIVFIAQRTATLTIPSIYAEKRVLGFFANPLPPPLDNEWGVFLLDAASWLFISVIVLLILIPLLRKLGSFTKTRVADVIIRIIRTPLVILLFLYGAIQSLDSLDRHLDPIIRQTALTVYQIALTIILIYLAYKLFKDVAIYLARTISKRTVSHLDDILVPIVEKVGIVIIGLAGVGLLLGYLSVDLTLFVAGGVVTSMVLAFAAQDTLSNFFSGIFILTDRPFKEGDTVILNDGDWVEVRRIGMRTTRLFRFSDASIVTLPNNRLVNEKIANFSNPHDKGRIMQTYGVGYGSDVAQVKKIIKEVIDGSPHILREEPYKPIIRFDAMGESSLNFVILVWIDDRSNQFEVKDYLNTEIYNRFNKAGIEIPFPQRAVHLHVKGGGQGGRKPAPLDIETMVRNEGARSRVQTTDPAEDEERDAD